MKKILTLCFVTALLAGCGTSSRVASHGESVDVGYGTQDKDKLTTSVSNLKSRRPTPRPTAAFMTTCGAVSPA